MHVREGGDRNVAVGIGSTLVSLPLPGDQVKHYFGDVGGFPELDEFIDIQKGVKIDSRKTLIKPELCSIVITVAYESTWT